MLGWAARCGDRCIGLSAELAGQLATPQASVQLRRACRRELGWQAIDLLGDFYRTQKPSFVQMHKQPVPFLVYRSWLRRWLKRLRHASLHRRRSGVCTFGVVGGWAVRVRGVVEIDW